MHLVFYVLANPAQVVVWQSYDRDHFFWPMWSIVFWGIGPVFHFWDVYSPPRSKVDQ